MSAKQICVPILTAVTIVICIWVNGGGVSVDASDIREDTLFTVHRGDLLINLVENGTLVAKDSEKLTPKMRGQCKILSLVAEGEAVVEGQEICKFDDTELNKSLETSELSLLTAETALSTAKTNLELQVMDNSSKTEKAKVAFGVYVVEGTLTIETEGKTAPG